MERENGMNDELEYLNTYSASYLREILKEYGVRVVAGTKKPALVAKLASCMRLQAAMTTRHINRVRGA